MPKLHLISLGCTKNLVDSEVMLGALSHYERTNDAQDADIIIVNTCGFIASAKKESVDKILEVALKKRAEAILIVSGCLSERYAEELRDEIKEIDIITGVGDYDKIESMIKSVVDSRKNKSNPCDSTESRPLRGAKNRIQGCSSATADFLLEAEKRGSPPKSEKAAAFWRVGGAGRGVQPFLRKDSSESKGQNGESNADSSKKLPINSTPQIIKSPRTFLIENQQRIITGSAIHAYIKISEGCNQQCSFCAIPHFKGRLHSRNLDSILREIDSLLAKGYFDFSFISQDSSSYMRDLGKKDGLIDLIKRVEKSGAKSARILYLYPSTTSESLIQTIAQSRVFQNYFDMPLQHISDFMLKTMKRGAPKARHIALLEQMRNVKNSFIRTSFLVGHPRESEADFDELCEFVSEFSFERANIFGFSREEGTAAFDMSGAVSAKTAKARIKKLNAILSKAQEKSLKSLVGRTIRAIIEGRSDKSDLLFSARDLRWDREIDGEILINDSEIPLDCGYYEVQITDFKGGYLIGRAISKI
ncbi:MiaB/RimO family radical SAM methylthiotransferase [Helicobacter sp. 23-1044]